MLAVIPQAQASPSVPFPARPGTGFSATGFAADALTPGGAGGVEQEPTPEQVQAARARVQGLTDQAEAGSGAVTSQRRAVQLAGQEAGLALETYTATLRRLAALQSQERDQEELLASAQATVDQNRGALGRWARQAYQDGGLLSTHATLNALLQIRDGQDVGTTLNVLRHIGNDRNDALDAVQRARQQQAAATEAAADASDAAASAAIDATNARLAADDALAIQRTALGRAQSALSGTQSALSEAKERQVALEAAQTLAAQTLAAAASSYAGTAGRASGDNRVTGQTGTCAGGAHVEQYPNGQIPLGSLCPLASAPGHFLRADAAYAFDRLSNAYAQRFGTPICVTDSYRSLAAQIDVYARKPNLAAHPGTSNHGWGTATDLCGGIQSFASAQHHWMQMNAPLYNWFHPAWAQADGSKPEPWHWEFAG